MSIEQGVVLTLLMAVVSFAGSWGGASARLKRAERDAERAHERIDDHIRQHLQGDL